MFTANPAKARLSKSICPRWKFPPKRGRNSRKQTSLPRGNGETVLVVDDEASILTITSQTLQAFGYRVLTATDGAEAVAIYAQHKNEIAVVLTDMMMPIMDGPATIRALMRINPDDQNHCGERSQCEWRRGQGYPGPASSTS